MSLIKSKIVALTFSISCLLAFGPCVTAQKKDSKKQKETAIASNGSNDREYWSQLLYKMSYPVIHNLAQEL